MRTLKEYENASDEEKKLIVQTHTHIFHKQINIRSHDDEQFIELSDVSYRIAKLIEKDGYIFSKYILCLDGSIKTDTSHWDVYSLIHTTSLLMDLLINSGKKIEFFFLTEEELDEMCFKEGIYFDLL